MCGKRRELVAIGAQCVLDGLTMSRQQALQSLSHCLRRLFAGRVPDPVQICRSLVPVGAPVQHDRLCPCIPDALDLHQQDLAGLAEVDVWPELSGEDVLQAIGGAANPNNPENSSR